MDETVILDQECEKCGSHEWMIYDEDDIYKQFCAKCGNYIEIIKIDYLRDFQCSECGCLEGTIEENDNLLAIRCKHCGKQTIMLEKHTTDNRRHIGAVPQQPKTYAEIKREQQAHPKCPKCGCTEFTPVRKKFSLLTGFATNKVELVCNNCGYRKK